MKKVFHLNFNVNTDEQNNIVGFNLKREPSIRECRYILKGILRITLLEAEDFGYEKDYKEYNEELVTTVVGWLTGKEPDEAITELCGDCSDEPLGFFNSFFIAEYLIKRGII